MLPIRAFGRSWTDIELMHGMKTDEIFNVELLATEIDPLGTPQPTANPAGSPPTSQPTRYPTYSPSAEASAFPSTSPSTVEPTRSPTFSPTIRPADSPTRSPTFSPTIRPTDSPTSSPTEDLGPYPFNDPPLFPDPWYFNYDTRHEAKHGPGYPYIVYQNGVFKESYRNNKWADLTISPNDYYMEFSDEGNGTWKGVLGNHVPSRNKCGTIGLQSPIDVKENGLGVCEEHHEVRSLSGDFRLAGENVVKEINPNGNKLRLRYQRRPCHFLTSPRCMEPDPPKADFPNGWGGFADVVHVDFKVPSEHLLEGKRYDAELQVFYIHKHRRRMPSQATLIQATDDGFNWYFDEAIKAFDHQFQVDAARCAAKQRRERQLVRDFQNAVGLRGFKGNSTDYDTWGEYSIVSDSPYYQEQQEQKRRELQSGVWDPHHPLLIPSIHFYRYEGSLTEPPCGEWVSWFVTDVPMTISKLQLAHLKHILFNHVDGNCRRTSVQYKESVARPIQQTDNRPVYKCTSADFGPDEK